MNSDAGRKTIFKFTVSALILIALRVLALLHTEFQYDELWSFIHFVPLPWMQILTDISLPNNHPLNTLIIKLISPQTLLELRLGVMVCGAAVIALIPYCVYKITRSTGSAWYGLIFAALSLPLLTYSITARGYIYQCSGLLLTFAGLLDSGRAGRKKIKEFIPELCVVAGCIITILSVPSGVMFLLPLAVGTLIFADRSRLKSFALWGAAAFAAGFAVWYYSTAFSALQEARQWGTAFTSPAGYGKFFVQTLYALLPLPLLFPIFFAVKKNKKRYLTVIGLALLPLLLSFWINGGGARVYLPLTLVFIIIAAVGMGEADIIPPRLRDAAAIFIVVLSIFLTSASWYPALPVRAWRQYTALPECADAIPILSGSAGFPARHEAPGLVMDFYQRCANLGENGKLLLLEVDNRKINGCDLNFSETELSLNCDGVRLSSPLLRNSYLYNLRRTNAAMPGETVMVINFSGSNAAAEAAGYGKVLHLNIHFREELDKNNLFLETFILQCDSPLVVVDGIRFYRIEKE